MAKSLELTVRRMLSSGPKRYDWSDEQEAWFYARDGSVMLEMLETELSEKLGIKTDLR